MTDKQTDEEVRRIGFTEEDERRHRNSARLLYEQLECQGPDATWDFPFDEAKSKRSHAEWHVFMADRIALALTTPEEIVTGLEQIPSGASLRRTVAGGWTLYVVDDGGRFKAGDRVYYESTSELLADLTGPER